MFCRRYIKKIFSLVSVENHSKFCFPKMFFMRSLFRFPKLPYTLDFHVLLLVSQKSVMGNKTSSLSTNRARSSFFKAFFLKLFFFLIRFCSSSGIMATSGITSCGWLMVKWFFMSNPEKGLLHEGHSIG